MSTLSQRPADAPSRPVLSGVVAAHAAASCNGFETLRPKVRRRLAVAVVALHVVMLLTLGLSRAPTVATPVARDLGLVWVSTAAPQPPAPLPPAPTPALPAPPLAALSVPVPDIELPAPEAPRPPAPTAAATTPAQAAVASTVTRPPVVESPRADVIAPPEPPAGPRTVSITAVQYLTPPQLQYPVASRRLREQGLVQVRLLVDEQGRPQQASVVRSSGFERLDDAALGTARATRFKPYAEDGVPRPFWVVMPLVFELQA